MFKRYHSRRQCSSSPASSQPCSCFLCLMLQSLVACPIPHPAGSAACRHAPNPIFPHPVFCGPGCLSPTSTLDCKHLEQRGSASQLCILGTHQHGEVHLVGIRQTLAASGCTYGSHFLGMSVCSDYLPAKCTLG